MSEFKPGDRVRNHRYGYAGHVRKYVPKPNGCIVKISHVDAADDGDLIGFNAFACAEHLEHLD